MEGGCPQPPSILAHAAAGDSHPPNGCVFQTGPHPLPIPQRRYNRPAMPELREQLQTHFGLEDFRPAQRGVIEDVLAGRDVLCVMPTGAGKSLCYQLPAVIQRGLTIVVSPLISLMEDQVSQLKDEEIEALFLNSSLTPTQQRATLSRVMQGFHGLLYVAPERFFAGSFQSAMEQLNVKLLAIDEAHCISQWGHDFRPEYARLGEVRQRLKSPSTIALTATATEDVRQDIIHQLQLNEPSVVITGFDRTNLIYDVRRINKVAEKDAELLRLLQDPGSGIVYCATRKNVDTLARSLAARLKPRLVVPYHAGLDAGDRTSNQEQFMDTPGAIAVATNAFGMGINKPDIRFVVHYNTPGTLEAYYQEAGRAGRDGSMSRCTLLYSFQDRKTQEFFIDKLGAEVDNLDPAVIAERQARARQKLDLMVRFAQTHRCRRQQILDYFGDEGEVPDCQCDVCRGDSGMVVDHSQPISEEAVLLVRQLLSGVARMRGKFGVGAVAEVLTGVENERATKWNLQQLTCFGLLAKYPAKRVIAMLHRLIEAGLVRQRALDSGFGSVAEISATGLAVMKSEQSPPAMLADLVPTAKRGSRANGTNPRALGTNPRANREPRVEFDDRAELDPDEQSRFDRLRRVRSELARAKQLPPYCICHDKTLAQIARIAPASLESLEDIKGMGPFKVKMYGQQLLAALSEAPAE